MSNIRTMEQYRKSGGKASMHVKTLPTKIKEGSIIDFRVWKAKRILKIVKKEQVPE